MWANVQRNFMQVICIYSIASYIFLNCWQFMDFATIFIFLYLFNVRQNWKIVWICISISKRRVIPCIFYIVTITVHFEKGIYIATNKIIYLAMKDIIDGVQRLMPNFVLSNCVLHLVEIRLLILMFWCFIWVKSGETRTSKSNQVPYIRMKWSQNHP